MQHRREDDVRTQVAFGGRPDDARENLLTVGARPGTIPATDLARTTVGRMAGSARQLNAEHIVMRSLSC